MGVGQGEGYNPDASYNSAVSGSLGVDYMNIYYGAQRGPTMYVPGAMGQSQNQAERGRRGAAVDNLVDNLQHGVNFYTSWQRDAAWRQRIINYGIAMGTDGAYDTMAKKWNDAGAYSNFLYTSSGGKVKVTPEQVLKLWANQGSSGSGGPGGSGGTYVSTSSSSNSSVSYDISDAKTAKALTNAVLSAALGREATAAELEQYKKALNSYEKANPSRSSGSSHSTTVSSSKGSHTTGSSSSTSYSGASAQGREQTIKDEVMQTDEAQAWTTSNLFQAAMDRLASRIG